MLTAQAPNREVRGADATPLLSRRLTCVVEAMGAFRLVSTVGAAVGSASPFAPLGVGTVDKGHPDNSHHGLAIGFTVAAGASAVAAIFGHVFNPAVSPRDAVMDVFTWPTLWVYLMAQIFAGLVAGVTFLAISPTIGKPVSCTKPLAGQPIP